MRYRAIAIGLLVHGPFATSTTDRELGRPVQMVCQDKEKAIEWAKFISEKYKVKVEVYAIKEELIAVMDVNPPQQIACTYNHQYLKTESAFKVCPGCNVDLGRESLNG
jgi:hypothetical protein